VETIKFRRNKVKREHGMIENALQWLENLGRLSEVTDIIPGVIDVSHSSERGIVYKYVTQTGCKLLVKSNGSIQEVFVVTKNPACVQAWVQQEFPTDTSPSVAQVSSKSKSPSKPKTTTLANGPLKSHDNSKRNQTPTRRLRHSKKRSYGKIQKTIVGNQDSHNLADHLDNATLSALGQLKQTLENGAVTNNKTNMNGAMRDKKAKTNGLIRNKKTKTIKFQRK